MRRILLLLAALAASAGCATPGGGHRLGAVNNYAGIPAETLTLAVGTTTSQPRITFSIDTWSVNIHNATGTASGTYTIQASADGSTWFDVTLSTAIPALASGSPSDIPVEYDGGWPWPWWRVKFIGTSGSGTAILNITLKG